MTIATECREIKAPKSLCPRPATMEQLRERDRASVLRRALASAASNRWPDVEVQP
jgi:hypothetical protein